MGKGGSVSVQMDEIVKEISNETKEATKKAIDQVSKEAVTKLKNTSPRKTGSYSKGWTSKRQGDMDVVVYNATDAPLTHLLENGHVIRNKTGTYGRVSGKKHIAPVEEWANNELPEEILRNIK